MSIIRRRHTGAFATVPNAVANDERLSFAERGLLLYLLAKPEGWSVNVEDLRKQGGVGRDAAYGLLKGLITAGYIRRTRFVDPQTKRVAGVSYEVFDLAEPLPEKPDTEKPDTANQEAYKNRELQKQTISSAGADAHDPVTELEEVLDEEHAAMVVAHFAGLGKPLTGYTARLKAQQLARSNDPNSAAEQMVAHGWSNHDETWTTPAKEVAIEPVVLDLAADRDLVTACERKIGHYGHLPSIGTRTYSPAVVASARAQLARTRARA